MSARILVVDDVDANRRLLEAKLLVEYYDVITAEDGEDAIEQAKQNAPDLILLDVMMPGMNGFDVCHILKSDPQTAHIPVVMVTALSDVSDRVKGLQAGADDFLAKPVNDVALFARIRSLVRLKRATDEWRNREATFVQFGFKGELDALGVNEGGRILLVIDHDESPGKLIRQLESRGHTVDRAATEAEAKALVIRHEFDLLMVDDGRSENDALRLCSQLRSDERMRQVPIVLMVYEGDDDRLAKALELGINDYLVKPVDRDEMFARARSQIRRKRYEDELRANYRRSLTAALTDDLTGLNNRRYLEAHFEGVDRMLADVSKPISLMILDIDRFKGINDKFGHAVGDVVLQGVAGRIMTNLRDSDTAIRLGGEEFVVLMPNTHSGAALAAAERLCEAMKEAPFVTPGDTEKVHVTISIGLVTQLAGQEPLGELVRRADDALYEAKRAGRNRVVVAKGGRPGADRHAVTGA